MGAARLPYQQQNITKPRKRKVPTTFSSDKCFTKKTKTRRHHKFFKSKIQKKMLKKIKAVRLNKQKVLLLQSVSNMTKTNFPSHNRSGACKVDQQNSCITSKTLKNSKNDSHNSSNITTRTNGKFDQQSFCVTSGSENCQVRNQSIQSISESSNQHRSITEISGEVFPANKISPPTQPQQTTTTKPFRKRKLQTTVDSEPFSKISKHDGPRKRAKPKRQIKKSRQNTSKFHKQNFQQLQNSEQSESHFTLGLAGNIEQSELIKTIESLSSPGTIQSLEIVIPESLPIVSLNIIDIQKNPVCSANINSGDSVYRSFSMPCLGHCIGRKNMSVIKSKSFTNQAPGGEVHNYLVRDCKKQYNSNTHHVKEPLVGQPDVTNSSVNDSHSDIDIIEDSVERSNIFELSYSDRTVPIVKFSQLDTNETHRIKQSYSESFINQTPNIQRSESVISQSISDITVTSISPVTSFSDVSAAENTTRITDVVPHQEVAVFGSTSDTHATSRIHQSESFINQSSSDITAAVPHHEVAVISSTKDTHEALQSLQYSRSFINYPNIASDSVGGSLSDMDIIEHAVDRSDPYELVYLNINSRTTPQNNSMVSPTERNFVYESESEYSFERSETYELPEIPLYPSASFEVDLMEALYREAYGMPEEDDDYDEYFDDEFYDDANDFQSVHEPTMHYYNIYSRCEFFVDMMEFENIIID